MRIADKRAKATEDGRTRSEKVGSRGEGVLLLVGRKTTVAAYYRYTAPDKKRPWIELGTIDGSTSLAGARERCRELAALQKRHPYLKEWLEAEEVRERCETNALSRSLALEATRGTLEDLLNDYLADLEAKGRDSHKNIKRIFKTVVFENARNIAAMKAREVTPHDIVAILRPLSESGAKVYRNRVRSYLHAAYEFGLKAEFDETRASAKSFGLNGNPVAAVPALQGVERVGERALTDAELRQFYRHVRDVTSVGPVMASFMQFVIAIGGQRPKQVLAAKWADYDLTQRTVRIIDRKGRGSKPRIHLVPLTDRALAILKAVKPLTERFVWPFSAYGRAPLSIESLKNVIKRFRASEYGKLNGAPIPSFTSKDLRRTCKQLMTRAQIRRDLRNLIQNHGQTGVDVTAYANDPTSHLPEKRQAIIAFEDALAKVLAGKKMGDKVVSLKSRRRA